MKITNSHSYAQLHRATSLNAPAGRAVAAILVAAAIVLAAGGCAPQSSEAPEAQKVLDRQACHSRS